MSSIYKTDWAGCSSCQHYKNAVCAAFPEGIPLMFASGAIPHVAIAPGQAGEFVYEPSGGSGVAKFKAAPAAKAKAKKTSKGQKKKNCSKGTWCIKAGSTGSGTCINANKVCRNNNPTPAAKKQYKTGKPKAKGGGGAVPTAIAGAGATQPQQPNPLPPVSAAQAAANGPDPVKLNQKELDEKRDYLDRKFGPKLVADAEANVAKILADQDTNVYIRVGSADTLSKILGSQFRTSAELGITDHKIPDLPDKNYQDARNRVEAKTLGYDLNTPDGDRPIYGYLGGKDLRASSHDDVDLAYGSIAVQLKADAKARTSFTGGDSFKSGIASRLDAPNAASLAPLTRFGYELDDPLVANHLKLSSVSSQQAKLKLAASAKNIDDLNDLAPTGNRYLEAQVHGGVKPSDIAALHFAPRGIDDRPTPEILKFAKDNNVDLYIHGKKVDPDDFAKADFRSDRLKDTNQALKDAMRTGDFDKLGDLALALETDAAKIKLAPGENDNYLKLLYKEAGYDRLPTVLSKAELDKEAAAGATLLLRGLQDYGSTKSATMADQLRSGDYFTGNGIYGNGTYVGHSGRANLKDRWIPGNSKDSAQDAWDRLKQHNYVGTDKSYTHLRMGMRADANVITQKALNEQIVKFDRALETWQADAIAKLPKKSLTDSDIKKQTKAFANSLQLDPLTTGSGVRVLSNTKDFNGVTYREARIPFVSSYGDSTATGYALGTGRSTKYFVLDSSGNLGPALTETQFKKQAKQSLVDKYESGIKNGVTTKDVVISDPVLGSSQRTSLARHPLIPGGFVRLRENKFDNTWYYDDPIFGSTVYGPSGRGFDTPEKALSHYLEANGNLGGGTVDLTAKLKIDEKAIAIREVLTGDRGSGSSSRRFRGPQESSGRFATVLGYDAIALNDAYEPDRFMNFLNRGVMLIQDTNLSASVGASQGIF